MHTTWDNNVELAWACPREKWHFGARGGGSHLGWRASGQLGRQNRAPIDPLTLCRPLVKCRKRLGISGKLGAAHADDRGVQRVAERSFNRFGYKGVSFRSQRKHARALFYLTKLKEAVLIG